MKRRHIHLLSTAALMLAFLGVAHAAGRPIGPGESVGTVTDYNQARGVVVIDGTSAVLSADANALLQRQMAQAGWAPGMTVRARFSVAEDAAGQPVIRSIFIAKPRK